MANKPKGEKDQEVASMAYVKRIVRRNLKRNEHEETHGLNIYPMMDMMTILLVFMVMQFASSTASVVTSSDELKIPYSVSTEQLEETTPVQVGRTSIVVDGQHICDLRDGLVDPSLKRGGGNGFLIIPLDRELGEISTRLKRIAEINPQLPFTGDVQIIADSRTPFRTLSEIIYTLGQNGFKNMRFMVDKPTG